MSLNHEDSPQRFFDEIDDKPAVFPSQASSSSPSGRVYSNSSPTTKKLIKSQSPQQETLKENQEFYMSPNKLKFSPTDEYVMNNSPSPSSEVMRVSDKAQTAYKGQNNIASPVQFLSQRKKPSMRQAQAPFEIKAMIYTGERNRDDNILSRNGGHEVDAKDF